VIFFESLKEQKNIVHGILERKDGSVNPFSVSESERNILKALKKIGFEGYNVDNLIFAEQTHGSEVYFCPSSAGGYIKLQVDGLVSQEPGQILVIHTADCLPILIYDPLQKRVAAVHAGRKGLVEGIIEEAIKTIGTNNSSLIVGIGPHIRKCCYFLRGNIDFYLESPWKKYLEKREDRFYFDLTKIAKDKLKRLGIRRENIEDCGICTFCQGENFYSARKNEQEKGENRVKFPCSGSFIGLI